MASRYLAPNNISKNTKGVTTFSHPKMM